MSRKSDDSSWGRRKSGQFLTLAGLSKLESRDGSARPPKTLTKKSNARPALKPFTTLDHPDLSRDNDNARSAPNATDAPRIRRPSLNLRSIHRRQGSSAFGSKSSGRSSSDEIFSETTGEPLSSTSTASSFNPNDFDGMIPTRTVVLHGEVQTSAGMFRKKKEYLVLTEAHILRYKSQTKAADAFKVIPYPGKPSGAKHGAMPSVGSYSDLQTLSDSSGDKDGRVSLKQMVAVHRVDDGRPYFALELSWLDEESAQASSMTLQFGNPEERDVWLRNIRSTSQQSRARDESHISLFNLENAARIIERDNDYDPANCAIYKIVQRQSPSKPNRASTEDLTKVASQVCFLAIGVHKVHLIPLVKPAPRSASPSLTPHGSTASYGVLTLTSAKLSEYDDTFELTFRQPLQPSKKLCLVSSASYEIVARLCNAENFLRPECGTRLFKFSGPSDLEHMLSAPAVSDQEHGCLHRTLAAYCIAYGVNAANVRYTINYNCEDAPRFELLPPADTRRPDYGPIALLAVLRALRYNESFGSLSFANITLDPLNGLHDGHGSEHVCLRTKRGTPIKLTVEELNRSCLLVQEIRALAATSKKLRRMDFSGCVTAKMLAPSEQSEDDAPRARDLGCGVVEALFPLCRHQTTNVDWICLNGIQLSDTDLDYLVGAAVDKSCHFRAIELNRCGLNDRSMGLILDALRAQDNTLEAIQIAGNAARLDPVTFDSQLGMFGFIRKLDLSYVSRTSGSEPLITAETLLIWRLQELRLSGTPLNEESVDAVATYLAHPQSKTLHELTFDNAFLSGGDIATIMHSLTQEPGHLRDLHLDISQNPLTRGLEKVTKAIAEGYTPAHLSMRAIEYREETLFRKMLSALTRNKTIQYLNMSQTALPGDAGEDTCRALQKLLAENDTLLELDISGEDSRLASSKFGPGINDALDGLKKNKTLQTLRIEKQRLGLQGASTLSEIIKDNTTLREIHCDNNDIPLHGLTDLVNSLIDNTTLIYLPSMADGREAAFQSAERTMKVMSDAQSPVSPTIGRTATFGSGSGMKRGFSSVRKSAARAASAYTPSFPALPSYSRSTSSPESARSSPLSLSLPPSKSRQGSVSPVPASTAFTVQDIQTTHRLLTEQWDRQCYRLDKYLERNWCLLHGVPLNPEDELDERFERPESAGSLAKVLQQVKFDTTPRAEKDVYFDSPVQDGSVPPPIPTTVNVGAVGTEKHPMSFKQFILESAPDTPDVLTPEELDDVNERRRQLWLDTNVSAPDEPPTPTQGGFPDR